MVLFYPLQKKEKSFNPPFEKFPIDKINKTYISKNACIYQKVTHLKSNYVFNIYVLQKILRTKNLWYTTTEVEWKKTHTD